MTPLRTFNVEANLPTLEEARRLVIDEVKRAKREGIRVLKSPCLAILAARIAVGTGRSGVGGGGRNLCPP